jgi:predicted Zn-dependent peptidase
LHTVVAELQRVRSHAVPPRELQRAKEFYNGQLALSLEDTMEHMLWIGEQAMMLGRVGTPEALQAAIARVDAEQVQRAARAAFVSPQTYLAVIGPVEESIGPSLAAPFAELR